MASTPRRLVNALREACFIRGVEIRTGLHVEGIAQNQVRVGHMILEAANIVICPSPYESLSLLALEAM